MKSLLLAPRSWDLTLDVSNKIAVASDPYSLAQDAACAIKVFLGEVYYDTTQGVPWRTILGGQPNLSLLKAKLVVAALTVPGVVSAKVFFSAISSRAVNGQVQVTNSLGNKSAAAF